MGSDTILLRYYTLEIQYKEEVSKSKLHASDYGLCFTRLQKKISCFSSDVHLPVNN